jgi:protein-arginine kinase activator protein McsA
MERLSIRVRAIAMRCEHCKEAEATVTAVFVTEAGIRRARLCADCDREAFLREREKRVRAREDWVARGIADAERLANDA